LNGDNTGSVVKVSFKDRAGLLGKKILTNTVPISSYEVKEPYVYANANLQLLNNSDEVALVTIWISKSKIPTDIDLIESNIAIPPHAVYTRGNMLLSTNEIIYIQTNVIGCVVRIDGFEKLLF
jgi:hypothetical protein